MILCLIAKDALLRIDRIKGKRLRGLNIVIGRFSLLADALLRGSSVCLMEWVFICTWFIVWRNAWFNEFYRRLLPSTWVQSMIKIWPITEIPFPVRSWFYQREFSIITFRCPHLPNSFSYFIDYLSIIHLTSCMTGIKGLWLMLKRYWPGVKPICVVQSFIVFIYLFIYLFHFQ